ncbi:MAG: insulinase family protein [Deltaproteobacteria bacterium]|nr:insulinase family protein [Deltaproteobacteria bacterium]
MTRRLIVLVLCLFVVLAAATNGYSSDDGKEAVKTRLDNGLTVVIEENRSAPAVSIQMWVRVGGADETDVESGISHVFEHMLFKGTLKRKTGEIASEIESVGGDINAYTSFDNTVYHLTVPSRSFMTGLDIIADAIQNSAFDKDELAKELEVVLEEIRMNEDDPGRGLYKALLSTGYAAHPYKRPVIGTAKTVKAITRRDMLRFFRTWYVPNNMTLVIAGDVDRHKALEEAKRLFKGFKKGNDPHKKRLIEPEQTGIKTIIKSQEIKQARLGLAFHIPDAKAKDTYAIDVLAAVLGGGASSRLYKRLKADEALVYDISAYPMSLKDPGMFFITATLDAKNMNEVVKGIVEEIQRISSGGPSHEELERAKTNLESEFIYSRETMNGIAGKLGYGETFLSDVAYDKQYVREIRDVTAEDIVRVAARYLAPSKATVGVIVPKTDVETITVGGLEAAVNEAGASGATQAKAVKDEVTKVRLDNGITLIIKEVHSNPTIAFYAAFPGGLRYETQTTNGIGNFTAEMLMRGTSRRTRDELAREIESLAGGVHGFSGWNSTGASGKFLSRHFEKGLDIFADVLMNPAFKDDETAKLKTEVSAAIKRQEDYLPGYTFKLLYRELYRTHPYGMPVLGSPETVNAFTLEALKRHHDSVFVPDRMILTIVGDVDAGYVVEKVKAIFDGKWTGRNAVAFVPPQPEAPLSGARSTGANLRKAQTHIGIGFPGVTIGQADSYALKVMTEVLAGQGGRLFVELRDKRSLAYALNAFSKEAVDPGIFAVYIATAPNKKDEALAGIFGQLKALTETGITDEELKRGKGSLIGGYEIGLQEVSAQAIDMTNNELFGLGYGFSKEYPKRIEAITKEDVLSVARKYLTHESYVLSIVGPTGDGNASKGQ